MPRLFSQIVGATAGLLLAMLLVPGVVIRTYPTTNFFGFHLTALWEIILVLGIVLGLLNYFLKPLLDLLSLPLRIITLGLFSIVINIGIIWLLDKIYDELYIPFGLTLLYATLVIWITNIIIVFFLTKHNK